MKIQELSYKVKKLRANVCFKYIGYTRTLPIDKKAVLLEGGQGQNLNGNMFALLRELSDGEKWQEYTLYWIITEENAADAKKRIAFYGLKRVKTVVRQSDKYVRLLASCGYLFTDNSFPPYLQKRDGQVILNTWHGTPLKTLGEADLSSSVSIANIQKNYLMCDWALFPNEFTRDVFYNDYNLKALYKGNILLCDYPRNAVLSNEAFAANLKKRLGFEGKTLIAYMPTWRGGGDRGKSHHLDIIKSFLKQIDKRLDDSRIFFVNFHFLLNRDIDFSEYKHIRQFPADYETYDFLSVCDALVTDYSSVYFDFAETGRKIVLFAYDKKEYLENRGTYFALEEMPFPIVDTVDKLLSALKEESEIPKAFLQKFCRYADKDTTALVLDRVLNSRENKLRAEKNNRLTDTEPVLVYGGSLNTSLFPAYQEYFKTLGNKTCLFAFKGKTGAKRTEFLDSLPDNVVRLRLLTAFQFTYLEYFKTLLMRFFPFLCKGKLLDGFYRRERKRQFYSITPSKAVLLDSSSVYMTGIFAQYDCPVELRVHYHPEYLPKRERARFRMSMAIAETKNMIITDTVDSEQSAYLLQNKEKIAHSSYGRYSKASHLFPLTFNTRRSLHLLALWKLKSTAPCSYDDLRVCIGPDYAVRHRFLLPHTKNHKSKRKLNLIHLTLPFMDVKALAHNARLTVTFPNSEELLARTGITYNALYLKKFIGAKGHFFIDEPTVTVAFFRQVPGNQLGLYVRGKNTTDPVLERVKLAFAFVLSYTPIKKDIIFIFEKDGIKYEESASVLYEKLIDSGYNNAFFLISRESNYLDVVPERYRKNLLYKNTFKHYYYFFKSKKFFGTEMMAHAIDLRTASPFAIKKIADKNLSYVFLQHGVMYMVSLDSKSRKQFKRHNLNGLYRVVVSSKAEADHFIKRGGHFPEDLYISGLPKFDKSVLNSDADRITIMPTWRQWEINDVRSDFSGTKYYKMIMRIFEAVPDDLKSRVIILPHPLFAMELNKLDKSVNDAVRLGVKYDDILKQTKLLITDYSSISYDAFYRGSNVIFYWEEKEECMEAYGENTTLLLNEDNVFGDICYTVEPLTEVIRKNYAEGQQPHYQENYAKIVEFHDGKNAERLIEFMKKDGLL